MKTFQRATLQIFDLPHHPRRLRQAVRRWREWRLNSDVFSPGDVRGKTSRDRPAAGDGFGGAPRDGSFSFGGAGPGSDGSVRGAQSKNVFASGDSGYFGFGAEGERFVDDGAFDDPPDARPSDGFASARAALASCDVCRCLAPDVIAKLASEHMREVHIAAGEDVFRGRVRDDELAVLVSGASNTTWSGGSLPAPFPGAPGCDLLVDPVVLDMRITPNASVSFSVPNNVALEGAELFHQWGVLDAVNSAGIVLSNGGRARIGN